MNTMETCGVPALQGVRGRVDHEHWHVGLNGRQHHVSHIIWESFEGPVPEGFVVHHRDGNPLNDNLENLLCMSNAEHTILHHTGRRHDAGALLKMRIARTGTHHTTTTRAKMSVSRKRWCADHPGHKHSAETLIKIGAASKKYQAKKRDMIQQLLAAQGGRQPLTNKETRRDRAQHCRPESRSRHSRCTGPRCTACSRPGCGSHPQSCRPTEDLRGHGEGADADDDRGRAYPGRREVRRGG